MGITVNTSPQQITASVGETKIDVSVGGGLGPTGSAGPQGPAGPTYTLPVATASVLGGVKIGSGISIDVDGVISASSGYTLPTATNSVLGGVKIGSGVTITDGVISVSTNYAAASHTHATSDITGLDATLSGISSALDGKAAVSHGHEPADIVNTGSEISFEGGSWPNGETLVDNLSVVYSALTGKASLSHAHSAADVTSGTFDIARIPTGTSSTTVSLGNHTHSQLHDRSHAITSTSDHTAGNWKVIYTNGSGQVAELALGASGTVLQSNGASSAPSFAAVSGESFHPFLLAGM